MDVQPHQGAGDGDRATVSSDSGHYGTHFLHCHWDQVGLNPKAGPHWGTWERPNTSSGSASNLILYSH